MVSHQRSVRLRNHWKLFTFTGKPVEHKHRRKAQFKISYKDAHDEDIPSLQKMSIKIQKKNINSVFIFSITKVSGNRTRAIGQPTDIADSNTRQNRHLHDDQVGPKCCRYTSFELVQQRPTTITSSVHDFLQVNTTSTAFERDGDTIQPLRDRCPIATSHGALRLRRMRLFQDITKVTHGQNVSGQYLPVHVADMSG